jgi:glycosyltransferase involved in cell wall biosynthesis
MSIKLSIITINYNNLSGLQKTMQSVFDQTWNDFEYIIIDGGSTDGSKELIELNSNKINYWVSEIDNGIYNAMNKGISIALGEYIYFLNSGDYLYDNSILLDVSPLLTCENIIYGNLVISEVKSTWIKFYPNELTFSYFFFDSLPHSAGVFIKKESFILNLKAYDENIFIISDWKWYILAIFKYSYSYKYIDKTIGVFDFSGISSKVSSQLMINNKSKILEQEFPLFYKDINEYLFLKTLMKSRLVRLYFRIKGIEIKN